MHSIVARLEALASNARGRQGSHPDDSTAWHYEHGVGDAYAYAARIVSQFAQAGTVAHQQEVVPFSSPAVEDMNSAQADYERFKAIILEASGKPPATLSPLQYLDHVLLALAPATMKAINDAPDAYLVGNIGMLMHQLLEMRFRHYGAKNFSVSQPLESVQEGQAPCPASCPVPSPSAASSHPGSESGSTDMHNYSKSSSSSSLSFVGSSAFDEEGNAPPTTPFENEGPPCESI